MSATPHAAHPAWAVHDLDALIANLDEVSRRLALGVGVIASIKANAYGHGALEIAQALDAEGLVAFMTGSYEEARAMVQAGIRTPIAMFAGALPDGMADLRAAGLVPTIVDMAGARAAAAAASPGSPSEVYVKVDAGLGRLGVALDEAEAFLDALARMPALNVAGLYTHLPFATAADKPWAAERLAGFDGLLARLERRGLLPPVTQARASCCLAAGLDDTANAVCIGHLLFGLSPFADPDAADLSAFRPVLAEVGTRLVQVGAHGQGSDVAIAGAYGIARGRRTGVAPVGVANGLARPVPDGAPQVLIRGRRAPLLAVTLEHIVVDLDGIDDAEVGDTVLLLGDDGNESIGLDHMAAWFGKSGLDTVMALSGRLPVSYRGGRTAMTAREGMTG